MAGLSRFDFYPRDWHLDTRDLSAAAKGIYIDLLSSMYARGGPLPYHERDLCRICGCATARSLRPLLGELISKGKLRVVDGHLVNGRTMEEIAKAERRQAVASEGGNARSARVQPEFGSNSARTHPETRPDIEENQQGSLCSPSPSPSPSYSPSESERAREDVSKPAHKPGSRSQKRVQAKKTPVPESWAPDDIDRSFAAKTASWSPRRIVDEAAQFVDHHRKKDDRFADWKAAWRTWVRNGAKYDQRDAKSDPQANSGVDHWNAFYDRLGVS